MDNASIHPLAVGAACPHRDGLYELESSTGDPLRRQADRSLTTQQHGALAHEGISSMVCRHMAVTAGGQGLSFTDNFVTGPASEFYGPYVDTTTAPKPMPQALSITPQFADQIIDSNLCGNCHNILLPGIDNAGKIEPWLMGPDQIEYVVTLDAGTLARVDHVQVLEGSCAPPPRIRVLTG